ncbi:benzoate/H(+) symporter BenE family transporter [Methylocapsa sp. S129]|uniref:benzoate/H(+) symporter BenE family transporter n=1 Tax=Methylocapsa sp. S129 TaxID=1641869 RepID=UPI00131B95A6|nr:benzoate/H(+) symporter BenE family transporter [Methylocapsa sp. S129]
MRPASLLQPISAGLVAAFVGYASSFAVILKGLTAVGATDGQAASGLMALSIAMGIAGIGLSCWSRMPISAAWSTPGAALLASTGAVAGGFPAAVGAFLVVGALLVAAGLIRPFGRAVAAIPATLANAMLAGVLFSLCLAPVKAMAEAPRLAAPIVIVWVLMARWKRLYATPAAAIVAGVIIFATSHGAPIALADFTPHPIFVGPSVSVEALISLALPLFIVTMASQNLPGLAVLSAYDYRPAPGPLIATTGLFTLFAAPFGGHAVNLGAITAALCAAPDAHPDPAKRWIAAASAGFGYVALGLLAGAMTSFVAGSPILIEAVAGLALLGAFGSALNNALAKTDEREAALVTFLTAASGLSFFGIGGAFWGLIAGGAILALTRAGAAKPPAPKS